MKLLVPGKPLTNKDLEIVNGGVDIDPGGCDPINCPGLQVCEPQLVSCMPKL